MMIDLTIVRLKENKEIVGIFEHIPSITDLWWKIDEIVDPGLCEYADIDHVDLPFEIFFSVSKQDLDDDDDISFFGELGQMMGLAFYDLIEESEFYEFVEIHPGIDYVAIELESNEGVF